MRPTSPAPAERPRSSTERLLALWKRFRPYWPLALAAVLVLFSLYVRYVTRGMTNSDMEAKILVWYSKLQRHGPFTGLGKDFYNYTPPYLYLLSLATLTSSFIAPLTSVKIIALVFDVFGAAMVYLLVRLHRPTWHLPLLAAAIFFSGATWLINSAVWGQADSTYTTFLLACLYLLLINRPALAVAAFSIALAFKPQGIFIAPFLLLMLLWGRMRWYHLLLVPVVYALCMAPAVAFGRTWLEVFTAYTGQADAGKALTHNAATLYVFIPRSAYSWLFWPAVIGAIAIFLAWVYITWRTAGRRDVPAITLLALVCVTLVPFFLPNMRERYYYPADTLALILAFMAPSLWYFAILFQVLSLLSYAMFLWAAPPSYLQTAAVLSFLTLALLLRQQYLWRSTPRPANAKSAASSRVRRRKP
jgi:Gpi18-like mannosyltransferase